jgi:DNA polymerase-3 subunit gamma/tau
MSYQVLARKWRPQDFDHLVGQESIVAALRNALREGRIAQAYVFSGIRGVGKTTAARVLAKALNCATGPTPDPCNECLACKEITAGADLDVLEIDAATYSKVEQIRDLTESLRYGPARDRYKVVVLDEVHRLSRQAFDALLKIVEEPPPGLVFVFATTEIDAVPATILSRCQEYAFRRVPMVTLVAHLQRIATAENIRASEGALRLIARAGEGSVRDSVALLDQLATFGGGTVDEVDAARLVGGMDTALFRSLLAAILESRSTDVAAAARQVDEQGWDPRQVFAHFLTYCRTALHLAMDRGAADSAELAAEEIKELAALARHHGYESLLRLLHFLLQSEPILRRSEVGGLALEIAWLRAAELPKLEALESLLAEGSRPETATDRPAGERSANPRSERAPAEAPRTPPRAEPPTRSSGSPGTAGAGGATSVSGAGGFPPLAPSQPTPAKPSPATPPTAPPSAGPTALLDADGERLLDAVNKRRPALAARLAQATSIRRSAEGLLIAIPAHGADTAETLKRPASRAVLDEAMADCFPAGTAWSVLVDSAVAPPAAKPDAAPERVRREAVPDTVSAHPTVQAVLEIFNGRVSEVVAKPPRGEST